MFVVGHVWCLREGEDQISVEECILHQIVLILDRWAFVQGGLPAGTKKTGVQMGGSSLRTNFKVLKMQN
jgi:hypothetical protein